MKKLFVSMMYVAALATSLTVVSCSSDDDDEDGGGKPVASIVSNGNVLKGSVQGSESLEAKEYILNGTVIIPDGATLTIPAGTTIKANEGFSSYILVAQGGKLYANGTASAPVTFTANTTSPKSGFWGGVILNGKAPISGTSNDKTDTAKAEVNNDYSYGGNAAGDNSGSLTYVKIMYGGARSSADIEHNGLTLNGVGNGTKIENIYVLESADDAIEFFGGTVNVTNLLAVNPDDDMFDFTQGYAGTLTNCYGIWENGYSSSEKDPRGVEADGNFDGLYPTHNNQSNFKITNVTFVSNTADDKTTEGTKNRMDDVIKIRRGATAVITNALIAGTGGATDLIDMVDKNGDGNANSSVSYTLASTFKIHNTTEENPNGVVGDLTATASTSNTGATTSVFNWTAYNFPTLAK